MSEKKNSDIIKQEAQAEKNYTFETSKTWIVIVEKNELRWQCSGGKK